VCQRRHRCWRKPPGEHKRSFVRMGHHVHNLLYTLTDDADQTIALQQPPPPQSWRADILRQTEMDALRLQTAQRYRVITFRYYCDMVSPIARQHTRCAVMPILPKCGRSKHVFRPHKKNADVIAGAMLMICLCCGSLMRVPYRMRSGLCRTVQ